MSNLSFEEQIKSRRTFAIISHPDAGKTTLTEKLLLFSGTILSAGTVKAKKSGKFATSDWMEIEKQRGISVASSVMQFEYLDHTINLLDTPGHQDFSEDTYRVLTAVDCALMVIDATKGVEEQTIKLLEVCRLRNTPIITFLNKYDRETKNSIELIDEIESILKINCSPITWPIGMGKNFRGVFSLLDNQLVKYNPKEYKINDENEIIKELDNKKLDELYPMEIDDLRSEVELLKEASHEFKKEDFLRGKITPVFCGSAINNFGIKEILDSLVAWAPSPKPKQTLTRIINPNEKEFSGFIFKIQANMDPKHRDRIAFLRICSGKFTKGMKIKHLRLNKEINANNIVTFMSHNRDIIEEAFAGDIIGIPNHGNIQIGDSFSENENITFTGIPFFAPELFRKIYIKNPLKTKQLYKGLQQLGEEGAVQVFKPLIGNDLIIGAIGVLQFEVVSSRLKNEYNVDIQYENCNIWSARWISSDSTNKLAEFEKNNSNNLSIDAGGNLTYLVPNRVNLQLTEERWPDIKFHKTREHSIKL